MSALDLAKHIILTLKNHGFTALIAGGWVRDYILNIESDDIDIATSASPEQIKQLFHRHLEVGAQFGIIIVQLKGHQFEVATFRKDGAYINGRSPQEVVLCSSAKDDALRRDFTINGMFYDPIEDKIYDYVGGQEDLKNKTIRTIGSAFDRFSEDRLRMIRAVRFTSRFGFNLDEEAQNAIKELAPTLFPAVSMERIRQEFNKMQASRSIRQCFLLLQELNLLGIIFSPLQGEPIAELERRIKHIDKLPKTIPVILLIARLFTDAQRDYVLDLHRRLKASNEEGKWLQLYCTLKDCLHPQGPSNNSKELWEWAHLLAEDKSNSCIEVILNALPIEVQEQWISFLSNLRIKLSESILRIKEKKPIVTSKILENIGVKPGKHMGLLLKEAERISVNESLIDADTVIVRLKQNGLFHLTARDGT